MHQEEHIPGKKNQLRNQLRNEVRFLPHFAAVSAADSFYQGMHHKRIKYIKTSKQEE